MFYDAKFGRKKVAEPQNGQSTDKAVSNGSSSGVTANGNGHVKNTADLAIYEQFQNQVGVALCLIMCSIGVDIIAWILYSQIDSYFGFVCLLG